jgi:hypothetical protein
MVYDGFVTGKTLPVSRGQFAVNSFIEEKSESPLPSTGVGTGVKKRPSGSVCEDWQSLWGNEKLKLQSARRAVSFLFGWAKTQDSGSGNKSWGENLPKNEF